MFENIPVVKVALVATSRDCFPISLSAARKAAVVDAYTKAGGEIVAKMAVLAEGDAIDRPDIIVLAPLPLFKPDGSVL